MNEQHTSIVESREKQYENDLFMSLKSKLDFDDYTMFYFSEKQKKLFVAEYAENIVDLIKDISFKYGKGLSAWNIKKKRQILLNELSPNENSKTFQSFLSIPILEEKKVLGIINFAHNERHAFNDLDIQKIQEMTPSIIEYLHNIENRFYSNST